MAREAVVLHLISGAEHPEADGAVAAVATGEEKAGIAAGTENLETDAMMARHSETTVVGSVNETGGTVNGTASADAVHRLGLDDRLRVEILGTANYK